VQGIDVVFSFDTTGSMYGYLEEVRTNLREIIAQLLHDIPTIRIGIIAHGDYRDIYVTKYIDLTRNEDELVEFVKSVQATGGDDFEEAYEAMLRDASENLKWSDLHAKALVVIGDAPPHEKNFHLNKDRIDWREEVNKLAAKNVKIYAVQCGEHPQSQIFYSALAKESSGSHLKLANLKLISDMFLGVCYREAVEMEVEANPERYDNLLEEVEKEIEELGVEGGAKQLLRPDESIEAIALSDQDILDIHKSLHKQDERQVKVHGKNHAIGVGVSGCRFVRLEELGVVFIEQNKERSNKYAQMARNGKKITWICKKGNWGLVIDGILDKTL